MKRHWLWQPCLALLSVLAACGGAAQPAPASKGAAAANASLSGKAAIDALYQQAKGEGTVSWYSSSADSIANPVVEAFEKTYPGVKVERTQKPAPQVMTDVQVQQAAKKVTIDVAQAADLNIADTLSGKMAMSVDWARLGIAADRIFDGTLVNYQDSPFISIYNKEKVPADQVPKQWDDLLDPRWQGKLALDGRGTFLAPYLVVPELGGSAKGLELATGLAAQKPIYQASFTAIEPIVISGQALIGNDALSNVIAAFKKNAPIDIVPISPVYVQRSPAYVPAGAPHPSAGQLLISWLASADGQAVIGAAGYGAAGSCSGADQQTPAAQAMCTRGMKSANFSQLSQFQQLADYLTQVQKNLGTYTGK
jgi:iron(III) transport system substrate-binding protein